MPKKITLTLEKSLINELNKNSKTTARKMTKINNWEKQNKEAIEEYNKSVEEDGLVLQHSRMF